MVQERGSAAVRCLWTLHQEIRISLPPLLYLYGSILLSNSLYIFFLLFLSWIGSVGSLTARRTRVQAQLRLRDSFFEFACSPFVITMSPLSFHNPKSLIGADAAQCELCFRIYFVHILYFSIFSAQVHNRQSWIEKPLNSLNNQTRENHEEKLEWVTKVVWNSFWFDTNRKPDFKVRCVEKHSPSIIFLLLFFLPASLRLFSLIHFPLLPLPSYLLKPWEISDQSVCRRSVQGLSGLSPSLLLRSAKPKESRMQVQ